jgi:hypothetical protein
MTSSLLNFPRTRPASQPPFSGLCAATPVNARATSGSEWMAPYLAQLIADPYDAVRYIAQRSLRRLPGYESFEFEFTAPEAQLREASERALQIWTDRRIESGLSGYEDSLINPDGTLQTETITRLLLQRDNSPIALNE